MLLLSTQMWIAVCLPLPEAALPFTSWMVSLIGVIRDLEDPDREMVEMRVAARHSGMLGAAPEAGVQETCHLSRVTAEVRKLKKPSCPRQEEQKTFRLRRGAAVSSEGANGRLCLSAEPQS